MKSITIGSGVRINSSAVSDNMAINTLTNSSINDNSSSSSSSIHSSPTVTANQTPLLLSVKDDVQVESIARYFGGKKYTPDTATIDKIHRCIEIASKLVDIRATYSLFTVSSIISLKKVILENGLQLSLPECIADPGVKSVAAVIGTLGEGLEEHCRDLANKGKIYESTLFDAVGTVMLDLVSDKMCEAIARVSHQYGLVNGARFAPGIDGYPLEQQHQLFHMADHESVGVFLNSSAIMVPAKSISFFVMLTKTAGKDQPKNKCSSCRLPDCEYRILPKKEKL